MAARDKNAKISVLITAGAGGVGSWAVQLAKAAGVKTLVAVVGPKNLDFARELGATEVIDYTKQSIGDWVSENPDSRKIDLVFDCIGGSSLTQSWYAVREGGSLISVCAVPEENRPKDVKTEAHSLWFVITPLAKDLRIISELLDAGKLKPTIDSIVPFDQFAEAWDKVESGRARGKVIVHVSDEMQ
ncbi:hypothetical protein NM208_g15405 [Fusarium decemcellulare]|uniref:Uncharacterized protein n=1 Tax=Fusarium decemcellulare TaxID=57161 RepID=A0ACC1RGJ8_9HYPO|nr:hypothetical protein NM208_g15405 [Fusarium decemcellulare]